MTKLKKSLTTGGVAVAALALAAGVYVFATGTASSQEAQQPGNGAQAQGETVALTEAQLKTVSLMTAGEQAFAVDREAVGSIDFNEDASVQVSPPYQGRVQQVFVKAGDDVGKGKPLFTIESPDLVQAESTLIGSAGTLKLTSDALQRAKDLLAIQGIAQKDYQQAVSDQQAAQGAHEAARNAVRIFGKSEAEIDRIVAQRRVDAQMSILSPISGRITARNIAPGVLVQPGGSPAALAVADLSTKWMLANVAESDIADIRLGQDVDVRLGAYPGRVFHGRITNIGAALDPNTRRITVRSEIADPKHELQPGMFAGFTIHTGQQQRGISVPGAALVREGDGGFVVWVTRDRRSFTRRVVKLGMEQGGRFQVIEGLNAGETMAGDGAIFISNAWALGTK
ncbi:MAG TPA: efflux RND transporter periplasmic adaptor subunit [Methylibium sp.]